LFCWIDTFADYRVDTLAPPTDALVKLMPQRGRGTKTAEDSNCGRMSSRSGRASMRPRHKNRGRSFADAATGARPPGRFNEAAAQKPRKIRHRKSGQRHNRGKTVITIERILQRLGEKDMETSLQADMIVSLQKQLAEANSKLATTEQELVKLKPPQESSPGSTAPAAAAKVSRPRV